MKTPTYKPCCPNHGEPLEGIPFPMPEKGVGMCPVSGASFEYEVHLDSLEEKVDKFGNKYKDMKWQVEGNEDVDKL